uniref:Uncharacterized protein n=1 Tax=viral metagenome TaxID=1070528 RepID=A0A6C0JXV7_9ZZZZ
MGEYVYQTQIEDLIGAIDKIHDPYERFVVYAFHVKTWELPIELKADVRVSTYDPDQEVYRGRASGTSRGLSEDSGEVSWGKLEDMRLYLSELYTETDKVQTTTIVYPILTPPTSDYIASKINLVRPYTDCFLYKYGSRPGTVREVKGRIDTFVPGVYDRTVSVHESIAGYKGIYGISSTFTAEDVQSTLFQIIASVYILYMREGIVLTQRPVCLVKHFPSRQPVLLKVPSTTLGQTQVWEDSAMYTVKMVPTRVAWYKDGVSPLTHIRRVILEDYENILVTVNAASQVLVDVLKLIHDFNEEVTLGQLPYYSISTNLGNLVSEVAGLHRSTQAFGAYTPRIPMKLPIGIQDLKPRIATLMSQSMRRELPPQSIRILKDEIKKMKSSSYSAELTPIYVPYVRAILEYGNVDKKTSSSVLKLLK